MTVKRVAVIGAGVMGSGMAQSLATAGYEARCHDVDAEQLERALELVNGGRYGLSRAVERGKLSAEQAEAARRRLVFTADFDEAVDDADLIVEAVPEQLALKMQVFARLDQAAKPGAILASNASGLPIEALAASTGRPELVIGWHWSSPPPVMRMAEIVTTPQTDAAVVEQVCEVARACGKNPVVVRENPRVWGYAANRVMAAMVREAQLVVGEGLVTEEGLDQLLTDGWGWPAGPFTMVRGASEGWGEGRRSSVAEWSVKDSSPTS